MNDLAPVPFVNPFSGAITSMPVAMIGAYVPYASHLKLEDAARVAAIRDEDAAASLLLSIHEQPISEGIDFDFLSVEPATLR